MRHGSLFSGIGGFDLAAEWMGWENIFHCELNPFGRKVLHHYWPNALSYDDITKTDFTIHRGSIDILTGGFPCQPFSQAGKRKGTEDSRHLWPEMCRAIREIQPTYIVGENVRGLTNWNGGLVFDQVQADLEAEGYTVTPFLLPACAVNAPHRRDRIWFVAYADKWGRGKGDQCQHNNTGEREIYQDITDNRNKVRGIIGTGCDDGTTSYANEYGRNRSYSEHEVNTSERRFNAFNDLKPIINNSKCIGRTPFIHDNGFIKKTQQKECGKFEFSRTNSAQSGWRNFPTQPPVCFGDDGLSAYTHRETISEGHTMDRTKLILQCLSEGRIETNPETGKVFSRMIRGSEGELTELKGSDCNGYLVHSLKYNGIKKQVKAHQVIWISVNGFYNKEEYQIDHINRDRKDNRIQNLRLVTAKENNANQDRWEGGFTEEQKDAMFLLHNEGHMSFRELAEDFGCSKSRVHQIVTQHKFNKLDGITFPKWRNESIKAAGNAIVPQVALQIFKAIERTRYEHP